MAYGYQIPVVAHVGDMGPVHVHLSYYHEMTTMLENISWIKRCFEEPIKVENGVYAKPQNPGAGTTLLTSAMEEFGKPARI